MAKFASSITLDVVNFASPPNNISRSSSTSLSQSWLPPDRGFPKLNTDGSRCSLTSISECGDVIRNVKGTWIPDFSKFIGISSILEAELLEIFQKLQLVWDLWIRNLVVECDNASVICLSKDDEQMMWCVALYLLSAPW
ncbi:hypothetical protein V6N11_022090 [Hibiscus sabdariffa]|uniref:RNase H type-1 domain-containing protein n=1 Tax=Hibiscus sabdariffa TaxID=183260 RepID=A0ABR2TIB9_9ROSI